MITSHTSRFFALLAGMCAGGSFIAWGQQVPPELEDSPPKPAAQVQIMAKAEEQASLADGLFRRELYRLAAAEYQVLIDSYPQYGQRPDAFLLLAECFRRQNQPDKAITLYRNLLKTYPGTPASERALINLSDILVTAEQYDEALAHLQAVHPEQLTPSTREGVYYYLGVIFGHKDDLEKALFYYRKLPTNDFDKNLGYRPYAQLAEALILRQMNEAATAQVLLEGLIGTTGLVAEEVIREALFHLGDICYNASSFVESATYYNRLIEEYPDSQFTVQARANLGWALLQAQDYESVLRLYRDLKPSAMSSTGEELYLLASAAREQGMYELALKAQQQLVSAFPDSEYGPYSEVGIVECLYFLRRYTESETFGAKLLETKPNHRFALEIYQFLGQTYSAQNNFAKLAETYEFMLEKYWGRIQDRQTFLLVLAKAYEQNKEPEKAAATYRKILHLQEADSRVEALILAAENEINAGNFKLALADYQRVISEFPQSDHVPLAYIGIAEAHMQTGNNEAATQSLTEVLGQYPDFEARTRAIYMRGSLYYRMGRTKEAIADLATALKDANFEDREFARLFLAYALWEEGRESESLTLFANLLDSGSVNDTLTPGMLQQIGNRYLETNDLASARKAFNLLVSSNDQDLQSAGKIGLGKVAFREKDLARAIEIFQGVRRATDPDTEAHVISLAYLGESYRLKGQQNRALVEFQDGLKLGTTDANANVLLRYGMALILFDSGNKDDALRYATSAYVLFDDPTYSPDAMLLACRILLAQGMTEEAQITHKELAHRFPIALARQQRLEQNRELFKQLEPATPERTEPPSE